MRCRQSVMGIKSVTEPERGLTRAVIYTYIFQNYWSIYQPSVPTYISTVNMSTHISISISPNLSFHPSTYRHTYQSTSLPIDVYISTYPSSGYQLYIFLPTVSIHISTHPTTYKYFYHVSIYTACRIIRQVDFLVIYFFQKHFTNSKPHQS